MKTRIKEKKTASDWWVVILCSSLVIVIIASLVNCALMGCQGNTPFIRAIVTYIGGIFAVLALVSVGVLGWMDEE